MRIIVVKLAIGFVIGVFAPSSFRVQSPSSVQRPQAKTEFREDWTEKKNTRMKIAAEMPDAKFSYKSPSVQRTYGEQTLHVASSNVAVLKADLGGKAQPPAINMKAT